MPTPITDPAAIAVALQRRLMDRERDNLGMPYHLPPVVCADGFKVSLQASCFHYCLPRQDVGPWDAVELGFPSAPMPSLTQYAEEPEDHTETVFGYVPLTAVAQVLAEHGGLV